MRGQKVSFPLFSLTHITRVFLMMGGLAILLTGCQGTMGGVKGQHLQKQAQITLVRTGSQTGDFSDGYVTVKYQYTITDTNLQMAGVVRFDDSISGNFNTIQTFDLGLLLADAQAKVLMQQGLTTAVESAASDPVQFKTTVFVPPQAALMGFTYNGQAFGGGGESPTTFWLDPVER